MPTESMVSRSEASRPSFLGSFLSFLPQGATIETPSGDYNESSSALVAVPVAVAVAVGALILGLVLTVGIMVYQRR